MENKKENMESTIFDVIIIGGGPAGLTSAIYACRGGAKTLLIEEFMCGGQTLNTYEIKNYPAFLNISGADLSQKMEKQAKELGTLFAYEKVQNVDFSGKIKQIFTKKHKYFGKSVILCLGAKPKTLNIENEQKFVGRGLSYCAVCDGEFFKNKTVAIVGGGNSAMEDVVYLTNIASNTYLINRSEKFRAIPFLVENMKSLVDSRKINLMTNTNVIKLYGENKLERIDIKNNLTGEISNLKIDGLFIEIGRVSDTNFLQGKVELDEGGYIKSDSNLMTSVSGVFVAGDCRQKIVRQIITACGDGAVASTNALNYLQSISL